MKNIGKRYRIVRELGSGGMATVYLAEDKVLKRQVAVKMIKTDAIAPNQLKNTRIRFQREGQHLVRMSETPGIVNIYDVGEQRGTPYIVMSYMPGGSLRQHLGKPLPLSKAIRMLLPVMNALTLVHQQAIIHRDLKPGNILLDRYGNLAIADFGIAKAFESEETALTATGLGVGTATYMAPEQHHGEVSEQSDLYALGVILYEMVTGAKPFRGATPSKIIEQQVQGMIIDPRQFAGNLPDDLVNILQKVLAFERKQRYASVEEFKTALLPLMTPADAAEAANLLQGTRTSPQGGDSKQTILPPGTEKVNQQPPAPPPTKLHKKKTKKWVAAAIMGGILLLVVCVFGGIVALKLWEASIDNQQATRDSVIAQQLQPSSTMEVKDSAPTPNVATTLTQTPTSTNSSPTTTARPSKTVPPTNTYIQSLTPSATKPNDIIISVEPKELLPDSEDMPSEVYISEEFITENESVAKSREDPVKMLILVNEWGRKSGYMRIFLNKDHCEAQSGLREITLQTTLFSTVNGAEEAFAFYEQERIYEGSIREETPSLGDAGYSILYEDDSDCIPAEKLTCARVSFRRYNVLGTVYVCSLKTLYTPEEIQEIAIRFARLIDLKMYVNSN
jgi:serine/threonine protein kinase